MADDKPQKTGKRPLASPGAWQEARTPAPHHRPHVRTQREKAVVPRGPGRHDHSSRRARGGHETGTQPQEQVPGGGAPDRDRTSVVGANEPGHHRLSRCVADPEHRSPDGGERVRLFPGRDDAPRTQIAVHRDAPVGGRQQHGPGPGQVRQPVGAEGEQSGALERDIHVDQTVRAGHAVVAHHKDVSPALLCQTEDPPEHPIDLAERVAQDRAQ